MQIAKGKLQIKNRRGEYHSPACLPLRREVASEAKPRMTEGEIAMTFPMQSHCAEGETQDLRLVVFGGMPLRITTRRYLSLSLGRR